MNSISTDIRVKLISTGLVHSDPQRGWFITTGSFPSEPHECVVVVEGSGPGPQHVMDLDVEVISEGAAQIFVRGWDYNESWNKAEQLAKKLNAWGKFTLDGTRYEYVHQRGSIAAFSESEAEGTNTWVINVVVKRRRTS